MNRLLKRSILYCLSKLGILDFMLYKNRKKITILAIHGVMGDHNNVDWIPLRPHLHPEELQRVLSILSEKYNFITIQQCMDMLEGKIPLIDNGLLLTFDDGYRNNIKYALPICKKFSIKPTLFIATGNVDAEECFWFDRLDYALQQNIGEILHLEHRGLIYDFDATSRDSLKASFKLFRDRCKYIFIDDREMNELFSALSKKLEISSGKALSELGREDDWSSIVSWDELREAVNANSIDVGSHTVNHWRLDCICKFDAIEQLKYSKKRIENELNISCDDFCYPNGNYNQLSIELTKASGYRSALCTNRGLCKSGDNLMTLKRFNFPSKRTKSELLFLLNY